MPGTPTLATWRKWLLQHRCVHKSCLVTLASHLDWNGYQYVMRITHPVSFQRKRSAGCSSTTGAKADITTAAVTTIGTCLGTIDEDKVHLPTVFLNALSHRNVYQSQHRPHAFTTPLLTVL